MTNFSDFEENYKTFSWTLRKKNIYIQIIGLYPEFIPIKVDI